MPANDYLILAKRLYKHEIDESSLTRAIISLPALNENLLDQMAQESENLAYDKPGLGWAISQVVYLAAASQKTTLFLRSLSAWYLARAANHWTRPLLVSSPLREARQGFLELNEPDWVAACDWQLNELSWAKDRKTQSLKTLTRALHTLETSKLERFSPYCRLSLASNQIYLHKYSEAQTNIELSEDYFISQKFPFGQAQCGLMKANFFRSQNHFVQAVQQLDSIIEIFKGEQNPYFIARTYYQYGLNSLFGTTDLPETIAFFEKADEIFLQCDLELWHGICLTYLGVTVLQDGQLEKADNCFKEAGAIFQRHHTWGLLADNCTTQGLFNLSKGDPQASIALFQKAANLHHRIGNSLNACIDSTNLGKAYFVSGRYQDSLITLEQVIRSLSSFDNTLVKADCEMGIASAWFYLRNFHSSLDHLQQAEEFYQINQQNASLTTVSNLKARIYYEKGDLDNSMNCLQQSLERSERFNLRPQAALAQRLIGELLIQQNRFSEGQEHLHLSLKLFKTMGMILEQASCLLALADYYSTDGRPTDAAKNYLEALHLSKSLFDEIDWHAYAGLAELAKQAGDQSEALFEYRRSIHSLSKIRSNFWQAALSGSYASKPASLFSRAIPFSFTCQSAQDTLNFIEADKAVSLIQQFNSDPISARSIKSQELNRVRSEIIWLQDQMRSFSNPQNSLKSALQTRQMRQNLAEKSKQYEEILSHLERRLRPGIGDHSSQEFDLSSFRTDCQNKLGSNWMSLDYYFHDNQVFIVFVSLDECLAYQVTLSSHELLALEACKNSQYSGAVPEQIDLINLGNVLIPQTVSLLLDPDSTLILSPHGQLHGLPWNALQLGKGTRSLVECCIPVIAPSLHSLCLLWGKPENNALPFQQRGLVVGVSTFSGRHPDLNYVKKEVASFSPILTAGGLILNEEKASWQNLKKASHTDGSRGLTKFSFLHFASHFFSDSISGNLSGLALWGEDIYQDQLCELAPLPELVTLSGCSSLFSRIYPGDEHVGLPTTCLSAGAKSVVGSSWPVLDSSSADFMTAFYHNYTQGSSPSFALAQTQREFIQLSKPIASWAGYCCIGMP